MNPPPPQAAQPTLPPPPKKGLSTGCIIGIVAAVISVPVLIITILAITATLAVPAITSKAANLQAKVTMLGFVTAINMYETEYRELPTEAFAKPSETELQRTILHSFL